MKTERHFRLTETGQNDFCLEKPFIIHSKQVYINNIPVSNKRRPRKTFAFNVASNGSIIISIARCSKKDQFCRKIGKQVALGRLYRYVADDRCDSNIISTNIKNLPIILGLVQGSNKKSYRWPAKNFSIPLDVIEYIYNVSSDFMKYIYSNKKEKVTIASK